MDKKKNEFAHTLEELEQRVEIIKTQKKIHNRRLDKVEKLLSEKAHKKQELFKEGEEYAKKANLKSSILMIVSYSVAIVIFLLYYLKKDPVDTWFFIIVFVCSLGIAAAKMSKKGR